MWTAQFNEETAIREFMANETAGQLASLISKSIIQYDYWSLLMPLIDPEAAPLRVTWSIPKIERTYRYPFSSGLPGAVQISPGMFSSPGQESSCQFETG